LLLLLDGETISAVCAESKEVPRARWGVLEGGDRGDSEDDDDEDVGARLRLALRAVGGRATV